MKINNSLSDTNILIELGDRIRANRMRKGYTQIELAQISGISEKTISNAENGKSIQLSNLLKILRHIDYLNTLEVLLPSSEKTPMELIQSKSENKRQRFRKTTKNQNNTSTFKWGEDQCEKMTGETLELGNLLWGHSRGRYPVDRKYQDRFCIMLMSLGYDSDGVPENVEESPFIVRPYYWGDDEKEMIKPNFECKELGLTLCWYKYPLRDSYSNIPVTDEIMDKLEEIAKRFI